MIHSTRRWLLIAIVFAALGTVAWSTWQAQKTINADLSGETDEAIIHRQQQRLIDDCKTQGIFERIVADGKTCCYRPGPRWAAMTDDEQAAYLNLLRDYFGVDPLPD